MGVDVVRTFKEGTECGNFEEAKTSILGNAIDFCFYITFLLLDERVLCGLKWIRADSCKCTFAFCHEWLFGLFLPSCDKGI